MNINIKIGSSWFLGALQIAFIVLKLLNCIDWSWGLVLSPLWVSLTFIVLFFFGSWLYLKWLNK